MMGIFFIRNIDLIVLGLEGVDWVTKHQVVLDIVARVLDINSHVYGVLTLYLPS